MDIKKLLKEAFDAGYDYRTSLIPDVIKEYGENACMTFEEWYTEQKLNIHGVMQAEGLDGVSGAAVGQRSVGTVAEGQDFRHCYIRTKIGCHCTDECGYDAIMRGISDEEQP